MNLGLKNKIIVVTGGAKGIGGGISMALSEEGAVPYIIGKDEDDNIKIVEKIIANGGNAFQVKADLCDPAACKAAIDTIIKKAGRIDGLVNNAGVNDGVGLENGSYEGFMSSLHKNVVHYYLVTHHALPELIKTKGAVLNIVSKLAETGQGCTSAYAAANGARSALTREWAVELLKYEIRVNSIIVSECWTPSYKDWISSFPDPEVKKKSIEEKIPLHQRMTTIEEIANTAVFLLSEKSSHTTGQLIHVDGGYVHLDRALN